MRKTPPQQALDATPATIPRDRAPACQVALVGFGTVGRAVARIICERYNTSGPLRLTHICNRNIERKKQSLGAEQWVPSDVVWTEDFATILNSDVDIVIELIGGLHPAEALVQNAL